MRNITVIREDIRNAQALLDAQRAHNQALAADANATAETMNAAMAETQRLQARVDLLNDELRDAEARQQPAGSAGHAQASAYSDRRAEILRSNEYARAFAWALRNGVNPKNGRGRQEAKILFDALTEGGGTPVGADGGFLVPEDIEQQIIEQVRALDPLAQFFSEEIVTAPTGWRVTDTAPTSGLVSVDEMGEIDDDDDQPAFVKVPYTTSKKALILPVSNELATDNIANLFGYLSGWFAKKLVITENNLLIAAMRQLTAVDISAAPLNGIKSALNKGLDPAISALATVITNQSGFDVLDQLEDDHNRPLLQPNPTDETMYRVKGRTVHVVSDASMANVTTGEGASATTAADIFIGDGKRYATLFRVGGFQLASTDIGGSAWRTDSTELRGIARLGVTKFDTSAMVRRKVTVTA